MVFSLLLCDNDTKLNTELEIGFYKNDQINDKEFCKTIIQELDDKVYLDSFPTEMSTLEFQFKTKGNRTLESPQQQELIRLLVFLFGLIQSVYVL